MQKLALRESNIYRFREEFHEIGVVGAGSFGTVYKCINRLGKRVRMWRRQRETRGAGGDRAGCNQSPLVLTDGCVYALKRSHHPVAGSADE